MAEGNQQITVEALLRASKTLMDENDILKNQMKLFIQKLQTIQEDLENQKEELKSRTDELRILKEENVTLKLMNESLQSDGAACSSMTNSKAEDTTQIMKDAFFDVLTSLHVNGSQNSARNETDELLKMTMIRASLPELPKFYGSYEEFPLFERIYNITNETGRYTEELNHLRFMKCLDGEAKRECQRLLNSMSGGTSIMNHLRSVYGDPEKILKLQIKKLLNMKAPKDLEKHKLKDFVNELESFVINAENLDRVDFLTQPSIIDQLVYKLRDRHQDAWGAMKLANPKVNLRDLWKYLAERLKDLSAQKPTESFERETKRVNIHQEMTHRKVASECMKCRKPHELQNCDEYKKMRISDRKRFLRKENLCFGCLKRGHKLEKCKNKRMCNLSECKEYHHRSLHMSSIQRLNNTEIKREYKRRSPEKTVFNKKVDTEKVNVHKSNSVLYKILPVTLHGCSGETVSTYALLDDGSGVTLLDKSLSDKLHLKGTNKPLRLKWTGGITRTEADSQVVSCYISGRGSKELYNLKEVRTVEDLDLGEQTLKSDELKSKYEHLRDIPLADYENMKPKMLIGVRNAQLLTSLSTRQGRDNEPIAVKTKLGWTVFGSTGNSNDEDNMNLIITSVEEIK
jgi:hypothetical protein